MRGASATREPIPPFLPALAGATTLTGDLGPGVGPFGVGNAIRLAVPAVGEWSLPELDRLEIGVRPVGVVAGAGTGLHLVHDRAGKRVDRRLTEADGLFGLH